MEGETGKLFIGGISWDTNEDRLKEYFENFGEVVEAVIMRDRTTGRARGFGFVVFADPAVAERVAKEKHTIDGRIVEAKKAVPRDGQNFANRNISNSPHGSPSPIRTKKIFVGGLASTVTESGFKNYFDQFGTITDVVVMYDHNTQRPRGFGFITYDSEEAVDKVLTKTFHELNGKMVEVKRAVPKELSPAPTRSPLGGYNHGLNRVSSFLDAYAQGYNPNSMGGYGVRMDARFSPLNVDRSGYPPFSPSSYGIGPNLDQGLGLSYGGSGNFDSNIDFVRGLNHSYNGNSNRYNSPIGYGVANGGTGLTMNSNSPSVWSNGNFGYDTNSSNSKNNMLSGNGSIGSFSAFGNVGGLWGSSSMSSQGGAHGSFSSGNIGYDGGENNFAYNRNIRSSIGPRNDVHDRVFENLYGDGSLYGETSGSFGYGLGNSASDVAPDNSVGFVGDYSVNNRANRGIAT